MTKGKLEKALIEQINENLKAYGYSIVEDPAESPEGDKESTQKKRYKYGAVNKLADIDLEDIDCFTCVFLTEEGYNNILEYSTCPSEEITIGYVEADAKNLTVVTDRYDCDDNEIYEPITKYTYVITLRDFIDNFGFKK